MASSLRALLDLRRDAEQKARLHLEQAIAARAAAEEDQARWLEVRRVARAARLREERHVSPRPKTGAEAQARERYRARLVEAERAAALDVEAHLEAVLNPALLAESKARAQYQAVRAALEVAVKLVERARAEAAKRAERRAQDSAADHASHAFVKNRNRP